MCPKFPTNPLLKYTKCLISTNLFSFLKLCLPYYQKLFALAPTNRRFAEKNRPSGNSDVLTAYIKFFLKKNYCSELVEGVDLIFRLMCQISGLDNVSYKIQTSYRHF